MAIAVADTEMTDEGTDEETDEEVDKETGKETDGIWNTGAPTDI